jgi:hypothetical protein
VADHRGIRRRLAGTYTSQKRYNDARAMEIHGGYSAIYVNETPVIADDDVPKGYAFGLRNDAFTLFEVERPDFLADPESGKVWNLANGSVAGTRKAVWQAWWVWYANLGAAAPNQVAVITARPTRPPRNQSVTRPAPEPPSGAGRVAVTSHGPHRDQAHRCRAGPSHPCRLERAGRQ